MTDRSNHAVVAKLDAHRIAARRIRRLLTGASVAAIALGGHGAQAQVVGGGTYTTVTTNGQVTDVTTTMMNAAKATAFNRFSKFDVANLNTVNLILPTIDAVQAKTLVNVVSSDIKIDGTVNSRIAAANGQIGGNLFFVTSGGFIIGGTGTVNTGRLIVRGGTLTDAQMSASSFDATKLVSPVSSATIGGTINAPNGVDIRANTFIQSAGSTIRSGSAALAALPGASVSTVGLVEGTALVEKDGGIAIVGEQLSIGGTLTAWDGAQASAAGDIKLASSAQALIDNSFGGMLIGNYYTASTAKAGVTVTGTISGGKVDITADAEATTAADTNAKRTNVQFIADYLANKVFEKLGSGADVFYTHTDAQSTISIGAAANVAAKGDLTVKANSISAGEGEADIEVEGTNAASLSLAVGVAQVYSSANLTVNGALKAGGALTLGANNTATSDLSVQAKSTATAKAGAVAYTEVKANSTVAVNSGAKLDGSSVTVTSTNTQGADDSFKNTAVTYAKDDSPGGGVAAVLNLDLAANLTMNGAIGSVTTPGAVTIDAKTITNEAINNASARTGASKISDAKTTLTVFTGDQDGLMRDLLGKAADKGWELLFGGSKDEEAAEPDPNRKTTRVGAAVAVVLDKQTANLTVGGSVNASGAVNIDSLVKDATVRNSAKAAVAAERKVDGQATSIAGAAAWGSADYVSHATVGGTITAGSLAVNATTERPRGGSYDLPFTDDNPDNDSDITAWFSDLKAKANTNLGIEKGFFTSVAGASAKTDSAKNAAVSASIGVVDINADTRAWINPNTTLTLAGNLSVKALTDITVLNLGGALPVGFTTTGGDAAGAAVAYTGISPTTVAGIGRGVTVDRKSGTAALNVDVNAQSKVQTITLAPQAGKSNTKTGSGTFATNDISGATRAVVSKDARLDLGTGRFGVDALTNLEVWAVGGSIAVTKADGTGNSGTAGSVGVAGALNLVEMDTFARVADASGEYANKAEGGTAATGAGITAKDVSLTATDTGSINAISVAGSATSTTAATPSTPDADGSTQGASKPKGTIDKIKSKLTFAQGLIKAPLSDTAGTYSDYASKYAADAENAETVAQNDAISKGTPVTKGFGIAGSASVNLSTLTTKVETTGAVFRKAAAATAANATFTARAVEGVDMLSVTGGAAITTGSKPLESNTLISGAYGLSYSQNETRSAHSGTTVDGFGNVNIEAAANGSRIGAGMALSADTTKTPSGQTVAASVSHLIARDGAAATFTGGSITGGNAANGKVSLLAYNGLVMGAGAGGLSWSSNNAAGGAVTVVDIASPTGGAANAQLVQTPVSGFTDLSVRGLTAARIAGIAAAGAVNTSGDSSKKALSIGLSINLVSMDSTALIDTGATGTGTINVGGAVNVFAGDMAQGQTEALAAQGKTSGTAGASMLSNFAIGSQDFSGDDPIRATDLQGGTQILSIAVPIAASRGTALGVGFAWNAIDNDRTAGIIGGSANGTTPTITAGKLSVQAIDHSDIMALGVGIGGSAEGAGLMGSVSRNLIEGSSAASVGKSAGAANNLVVNVTGAPVAGTPNVSIGASGDGGIFSLAGAVAYGKTAAGGIAVGVNDITRNSAAAPGTNAGLYAILDGVSFKGTPDVDLLANSRGRIIGNALAIAGSGQGAAVAGAATVNGLAPTIAATAAHLNYIDSSTGDLKVRAKDESSILSTALVVGISGQKAGVAAGVSVNRIDADVAASLAVTAGDAIKVRNLVVDSGSTAATTAFGLGAGGGGKFGGAGSIAINLTKGDVTSLLSFTGGNVNTSGTIGVLAKRDATIDVGAGALAFGAQGAAVGASVIVSEIGGETSAKIMGNNTGTLQAYQGSGDESVRSLTGIRTGELTEALPQFSALNSFGNLALNGVVKFETATMKGVVVNANSTAATRTIAITGAIAGQGVAIGVTGVVNNVTGTTAAEVSDTNITVGSGTAAQAGVTLDVRASSQQVGMTFAGAIAGSGGGVAAAAPVISDAYSGTTSALLKGGTIASNGSVTVKAVGNQSSTTLAIAGAVSSAVAASVAGVSPRFQSTVSATLDTPSALLARGTDGVAVNADSSARALATFGTLAISGSGAGAGAVVVATNENKTTAEYKGKIGANGLGNVTVDAAKVAVAANGNFDAMVAGASVAGSAGVSLVGNGVGVVHKGEVVAKADALNYNRSTGTVSVKAIETVSIVPVVGQVAIGLSPTGAGASLGAIAVLSQSKVAATLARPTVTASTVDVVATGYNQIDALQLGAAIGGLGLGANVTYLGIGAVTDTGALRASSSGDSSDSKVAESSGSTGSGNKNMSQLAAGGSKSGSDIAGQTNGATSSTERGTAVGSSTARNAFTSIAPAAATVTAEITGNTGAGRASVNASTLTIDSDSNLRSKSVNAQLTGGIVAGSATVGITRNAAQARASLGNVDASGTTLSLTATTGEAGASNAPSTATSPTRAADAEIYSGTVGVGALAVGVADVKLQSKAEAESTAKLNFTTANIGADDSTTARTYAVGAVAGGGAVNVTVAQAVKSGTVTSTVGTAAGSSVTNLNMTAKGLGGATAEAYAGSGGVIFAGNAAVATATDTRTVAATMLEGSSLAVTNLLVRAATVPLVSAYSFGVAVSGGVAAGASVANATASGTVSALIGEGSTITCITAQACLTGTGISVEALVVTPQSGVNVNATAKGSAGGYLAAVNGASAIATTNIGTKAAIGVDLNNSAGTALVLPASILTVEATRDLVQRSESTGVTAAGLLAVGVQRAESNSSGTTLASVDNVDGSGRGIAGASVTAAALDKNNAKVQAGAGGLGAGVAALALTSSNGVAQADITPANGKTFKAGMLYVGAESAADYKADSDSMLATAVGASGTTSENRVTTSSIVNLGRDISNAASGAGSRIEAAGFQIGASNVVGKESSAGGTAAGAGGGVATGSAALVTNVLAQTATVNLRDGLTLRQYGGDAALNTRATFIDASVLTNRAHGATLDVGGVMQFPFAEVNGSYTANTNVNVGKNILIRADQGVGIGTNTTQSTTDTAGVQIYGLAGVGGGNVRATGNANGTIRVGDGTMIESMMDIRLSAGTRSDGVRDDAYNIITQADTFNWTALPLSSEANASSTVNANNQLILGAATIRSARDLILAGQQGTTNPSASGTGHNPYLELFKVTTGSGETKTNATGSIKLDGTTLTAGYLNTRTVVIENQSGQATRDGVAIAGATGFKVTTNDTGTDTDRLGQFTVSATSFNTLTYVEQQILDLKAQITARGLSIPTDPATAPDGSQERQNLRDALNLAASQSDLVTALAGLYETKLALAGTTDRPGVVIGGTVQGTTTNGVTRYGVAANGGLFAAGGRVTLTSDNITGGRAASVTATGGAQVTIDNKTGYDTIIGNVFVPFKVNGAVTFAGKAQALPGSVTKNVPSSDIEGLVSIKSGTDSTRADINVLGTVQNIAGAFKAATPKGNYVQFGSVNVANFAAEAPTGLFTVSSPGGTFSQGLPLSFFYGLSGTLSFYDVTGRGASINSVTASEYLASYIAAKRVGVDGLTGGVNTVVNAFNATFDPNTNASELMYDMFYRTTYSGRHAGMDFIHRSDQYGNPGRIAGNTSSSFGGGYTAWLPCYNICEWASNDGNLGNDITNTRSLFVWDGESGTAYRDDHIWQLIPSFRDGVVSRDFSNNQLPSSYPLSATNQKASITAQQVQITAAYIDVSGEIIAGPTKQRSLTINNTVAKEVDNGFFTSFESRSFGQAAAAAGGSFDLLKGVTGFRGITNSGNNIGAQFIATGGTNADGSPKGYIKIDDVAAAGGGSITLNGKILNTNPLGGGKLKVLNGFGNISIDNKTGYDIEVGTINAGLSAEGRITLRDSGTVTEFTNTVGGAVLKSVITNGVAQGTTAVAGGLSDSNPVWYNPTGRVYYVWTDSRSIVRDQTNTGENVTWQLAVTPWRWDETKNNQAPQSGTFLDLDAARWWYEAGYDEAETLKRALAGGNSEFVQVLSGNVTNDRWGTIRPGQEEGRPGVAYEVPLKADLKIVSGAKATYPIAIVFDQGTNGGGLNISSNAGGKINLTGTLTFGGGTVGLSAANSGIVSGSDGLVVGKNVSLTARDSIGVIGNGSTIADAPFRVNVLGGSVYALSSTGSVNLGLNSVSTSGGAAAATFIDRISAANGNVKIDTNSSLIGTGNAANIVSGGDVTLSARSQITGANYYGAANLASQGLRIDMPDRGRLFATAGGDIAIEQVSLSGNTGTGRKLQIGDITTNGDVFIKAFGSIVAADATATVDPEKLARFIAAADSLQLRRETDGSNNSAEFNATLDQTIRAEARLAYGKIGSTVDGEDAAAKARLTALFGFVPASEGAIATAAISRSAKIEYQLRSQGREAFDRYALFDPAATADLSRGQAAAQSLDVISKLNAFGAKGGITLSSDGRVVTIADASVGTLQSGGELYQIALAALAADGKAVAAGTTATTVQLQAGLQLYLDNLRAPVATLLPDALPNLTGLNDAAKLAAVSESINGTALSAWVTSQNLIAQRSRAVSEALGRVQDIQTFGANAGISLSSDRTTVSVTDWSQPALQAGGALYQLGLATLRSRKDANGLRDTVPLPTNADVLRGLQLYLDTLRAPIADLLPASLPTLTGTDLALQRTAVSNAISDANLFAWAAKQKTAAAAELKSLFGVVPTTRDALATIAIDATLLAGRTTGALWDKSMIDVSFPSTAFVPVADTQFETRKPVIKAQGVTLIAGNSIGSFDAQRTFSYDASGFLGAADDKLLAQAYLASSGPGDLVIGLVKDGTGKVIGIDFTTRRDQPLALNANGIVNAVAATNYATLTPSQTSAGSTVAGDIFLNNAGKMTLGTIVSEKWRTGTPVGSCALGTAAAATCESRIRIVAPDIVGTTTGAATLSYVLNGTTRRLDSGDGSAVVMGGLVRIEASSGSIVADDYSKSSQKNRGSIIVDAKAVEVLRAAGDISLIRRAGGTIGYTNGGAATYNFGNDLIVGDVFAGGRLQLDNPAGSFFVGRIPSVLESERRNSRMVVGTLAMRAAGDIGSADVGFGSDLTGLVGQFDIQAPIIDQLVAGYDYATGRPSKGTAAAGLGTGSAFLALRGVVQFGGFSTSILGARGDITIGTLNAYNDDGSTKAPPIRSSIKFLSDIYVGGLLNLTTDGDIAFPDPNIKISGLDIGDGTQTQIAGVDYTPGVIDLSRLALNLKGKFDYYNTRSVILGSLTAGGGTIESANGTVTVLGTLFGNGGPETPFTMKGKTGVQVGSTGLGSVALLSSDGNVRVTGQARATDLTVVGQNVSIASGLYGRSASITAAPAGVVTIGGPVMLQRSGDPSYLANFTLSGGALSLSNIVSAQDNVLVHGQSITIAPNTLIMNSGAVELHATGALRIDPTTVLANIGSASLKSGTASQGGTVVTLAGFSGDLLSIIAPVGITLGATSVTDGVTLATDGALTLNGMVQANNVVTATANTVNFGANSGVRDASALTLTATGAINGDAGTILLSRGLLEVSSGTGALNLGQVRGRGGSLVARGGDLTVASTLMSDGPDFAVRAAGNANFNGAVISAGSMAINAGGGMAFNGVVHLTNAANSANLDLDAGGALTFGRVARIVATAPTASVRINAGSVTMDPLSSIIGASVNLTSRGAATLGDIRATEANNQSVLLRASGALSVGMVTGGSATISATGGAATLRSLVKTGTLMVTARDDLTTNGLTATQATLVSSLGTLALNGVTRIARTDAPTTARLTATAGKAITIGGATSASGGVTLNAPSITTIGSGYLTDIDLPGALTTLRADTINVTFNTSSTSGSTPIRIDARGRSATNINDATFRFVGNRPVQFDALYVNRGSITAPGSLAVTALAMRDYLLLSTPNGSVALQGNGTAPAAGRTVQTGALTNAKLVVTPGSGNPAVSVNGAAK